MSARPIARGGLALAVAPLLLALAACSGGAAGTGPAVSELHDGEQMPLPEERAEGVPDECFEVYPWAPGTASLDDLQLVPADWPAAPADATLCTTTGGGAVETAAFVGDQPAEQILAHYETALDGYELARVSGEQNGTGYESLDGSDGGAFTFQIREAEGGFLLTFIDSDSLES